MSSEIEELMPVSLGKGCHMRIFIDHSKPADDVNHNWTENFYDGEKGSDVLAVPNHWHKYHDEVMEVVRGRMKFFVGDKEIIASAGDGPLLITRGTVHGFTVLEGEAVTFTERTVPSGDFKARFFQDMFQAGYPGMLLAMRAFYDGDTYVALPGNFRILDQIFTTILGFIAKAFVPAKPSSVKGKEKGAVLGQADTPDESSANFFAR